MGIFDFLKKRSNKKSEVEADKFVSQEEMNKIMLAKEDEYLEKHEDSYYDFFGTMGFHDKEIPFFEEFIDGGEGDECYSEMFHPFTPRLLSFCVHRLTNDAIIEQDLDTFKQNCETLKNASSYKPADDFNGWEQTIIRLCEYVSEKQNLIASYPGSTLSTEDDEESIEQE